MSKTVKTETMYHCDLCQTKIEGQLPRAHKVVLGTKDDRSQVGVIKVLTVYSEHMCIGCRAAIDETIERLKRLK